MINTKQVHDRRALRFEELNAAVADAELLADAERRGTLRAAGNWTLGQALGHLAFWANAPYDGYPEMGQPPWFIRMLLPLFKSRFLNKGMPAGVRIRGVPDGTFGTSLVGTDEALFAMRAAFTRLSLQAPTRHNAIFGHMTHADWIKLNLRHAELHLSFLHPS
jgi:hypothetical protein